MPEDRVLVVGTTPDYVAAISRRYPERALFLTDRAVRRSSFETPPDRDDEIVCDLTDRHAVLAALKTHLRDCRLLLSGVVGYDCEWLPLAAELAGRYDLSFPSREAVLTSRNKYATKRRWLQHGVVCPGVELIESERAVRGLVERFGGPVVLKPLSGAGSELTFECVDDAQALASFRRIEEGLWERRRSPMFSLDAIGIGRPGKTPPVLAEEYVAGPEFSADFIVERNSVTIIRTASKLRDSNHPFGTTHAYIVPARLPEWLDDTTLRSKLGAAAAALGLTRAICMVDFIVRDGELVFLELTPRIGGDCLPYLVRWSGGFDTIGLALDFAEGRRPAVPPAEDWSTHVGLRLFAPRSGVMAAVESGKLTADARVKELYLKYRLGHRVTMPPEDYDSWILGHVVFEPGSALPLEVQCEDIRKKINIKVEQSSDQELTWTHNEHRRTARTSGPQA